MASFVTIAQIVAEMSQFNGFPNGGYPPSGIFKNQILTASRPMVKRPINSRNRVIGWRCFQRVLLND